MIPHPDKSECPLAEELMAKLRGWSRGIEEWVELVKEYAQYQKHLRGLSSLTIRDSRQALYRLGQHLLETETAGIPPVNEITKLHIISFMKHLTNRKCSRNYVIHVLSRLKIFFRYMERTGRITENPVAAIRLKSHPTKMGDSLTVEEIDKLLDSLESNTFYETRNRAIIYTFYSTGIRTNELCDLMLDDYMPERGYIKVQGKGGRERLTPIGKHAIAAIDEYLKKRPEVARYRIKKQYLFISRYGRRIGNRQLHALLVEQAKLAGVKHTSPHMLRRTCATHMLRAGAPLLYVRDQLGHSTITSTQKYTSHTTEDLIKIYRRCMGEEGDNEQKNIHDGDW